MPSFNVTTQFSSLYLTVDYTVGQYSIEKNTTPVTIKLYLHHGGLWVGAGTDDCSVWVGSNKVTWTGPAIYDTSGGTVLLGTKTVTVTHNADGTWSGKIGGSERLNVTYSGTYIGTISGAKTITLPTIPRASTISATDANIGATSAVIVSRKSDSFTHSIRYDFAGLSGYLTASGGVSATEQKMTASYIGWTVPAAFYAKIPNAKSGECTLTCKTYSGNTQIGAAQACKLKVTASADACAPTVTGTVVDANEATVVLTGDSGKLVRFYSTALCTITATAKNSATIKSKAIAGQTVTDNTRSIPNVEAESIVFAATDSRGYTGSATVKADMVPYVRLTCNVRAYRPQPTDGSARLEISGNYYQGSFGAADNTLTLQYRQGDSGAWADAAPTISGNTYTATVDLTSLDYRQTFQFQVRAVDKLASVLKDDATTTIRPGVPVFDWGESDFNVNAALCINGIAQDALVDSGTSGIWTYRKYASGLAVCWGSTEAVSIAQSDFEAWGSWYSGTITSGEAFPFKFIAPPHMLREVSNPWGSGLGNYTSPTAANTGKVALIRPNAQAVSGVQVHFLAIGQWK
nr:MAG TPA: protein of unknown function DUF859 [Caudoviricetes sp.]